MKINQTNKNLYSDDRHLLETYIKDLLLHNKNHWIQVLFDTVDKV